MRQVWHVQVHAAAAEQIVGFNVVAKAKLQPELSQTKEKAGEIGQYHIHVVQL
mgnify:CR=1 FL=1